MLLLGTTESWSHVSLSPTSSHSLALGCPPVRSRQATDEAFTPGLVSSLCLSDPASPFWEEPRELVSTGSCNLTFNVQLRPSPDLTWVSPGTLRHTQTHTLCLRALAHRTGPPGLGFSHALLALPPPVFPEPPWLKPALSFFLNCGKIYTA